MDIAIIGVLVVGFVLICCVLAIVAFNNASNLDRKFTKLKLEACRGLSESP